MKYLSVVLGISFLTTIELFQDIHRSLLDLQQPADENFQSIQRKTLSSDSTQRVLLFVGPHKTGSSSIQTNLHAWIRGNRPGFEDWAWPIPPVLRDRKDFKDTYSKAFYVYSSSLRKRTCKTDKRMRGLGVNCNELKLLFRNEFVRYWRDGKSLVIASEGLDFVGHLDGNGKRIHVDTILGEMPWNFGTNGSKDDITVVINYRAPRREHLISTWHQCCMEDMSFSEYAAAKDRSGYKSVDSLHLADKFLEAGVKVKLVDMAGVAGNSYDLSNVVACDILGVPCHSNKTLLGDSVHPKISNVKSGMGDMGSTTDEQLDMIEKIIRRRDCSFLHLQGHPNLEIMYGADLIKVWDDCSLLGDTGISRKDMIREINSIMK